MLVFYLTLTNDIFQTVFKLKEFADNNFKFDENGRKHGEKRRNCSLQANRCSYGKRVNFIYIFFQDLTNSTLLYICEFCLKYVKSNKCLERHLVSIHLMFLFLIENATT